MAETDLVKLLIAVTSAFAGWLLAQFTSVAKAWYQRLKIKALLIEELKDLEMEVDRLLISYSRDLQIHGAKAVGNSVATGLSNHIFKNFYKDALLSLNQKQRISYQLIHSLVDNVNLGVKEFKELTTKLQDEHLTNGLSEKFTKTAEGWGGKAKAEFQNCAALRWQIQFHLTQSRNPDLSPFTKHHEEYLRYIESVEREIEKLIKSGETIPLENFNKVYNPGAFPRRPAP